MLDFRDGLPLSRSRKGHLLKPLALVLAIVFFIIAVLYATGILQIGAHDPGPHLKHAALFVILGVLSLVWMRFQSSSPAGLR